MINPADQAATSGAAVAAAIAPARTAESDSAVEFLTALVPDQANVRRRAFAALLRSVTREAQAR